MSIRTLTLLVMLGLVCLVFNGCAANGKKAFVGTWGFSGSNDPVLVITDGATNTVNVQYMGTTFPATYAGGKLTAESGGNLIEAVLDKGELHWTAVPKATPDLRQVETFHKVK